MLLAAEVQRLSLVGDKLVFSYSQNWKAEEKTGFLGGISTM